MEDYAKYPPYLLSGGQKQRVCIAGIMAMQPKYMVLDEPTAMLDPHGRRQAIQTLLKLHEEESIALIGLTHSLDEARMADRIIVLDQGKIALQYTPPNITALSNVLSMLVPLFQVSLQRAASLSEAMEARGYTGQERTSLYELALNRNDYLCLSALLIWLIIFLTLKAMGAPL
jgi:energy-coupling factor transporter ATP-binding protein EcfA2